MSAPHTAASEQPAGKLPAVLQALRALAETDLAPPAFYDQWLATLCDGSGALAGRAWLAAAAATWQPIAAAGQAAGLPELPTERLEQLRRDRLPILSHAPGEADSRAGDAGAETTVGVTEVWAPWITAGELRGAVVVVFALTNPQAQQGCALFVVEACDTVERFHLLHDRRDALRRAEFKERELQLDEKLHRRLDLKTTAATIANDGRHFLGVDRVSVALYYGRGKIRVVAVSGQTELVNRAGAMRALASLAQAWLLKWPIYIAFPRSQATVELTADVSGLVSDPASLDWGKSSREEVLDWESREYPPEFTTAIERYVDEQLVKRVIIAPLMEYAYYDEHRFSYYTFREENTLHGALILETFGEAKPIADEAKKIAALVCGATAAIRNARQYERLWLHPLWRVLGNVWDFLFGPGKLLRTALILGVLGAGIAALFLTDTDYTAYCRGKLEPVERRRVFAGLDGVVRKVHVRHGASVNVGDALIELQNTDLDIATVDLQGRRTSAFEQSLSTKRSLIDGGALSPAERTRLSGEEARLTQEIASLDRQLALLDEKRKELVIRSPIQGEITTWNADDLLAGRPVRQGQQLLTVARVDGPWELELNVADDRSGRVVEAEKTAKLVKNPQPLRVTYSPAVDPGLVREAKVVEIQNSADVHGPNSLGGGGNAVIVRAAIDPADLPQRRPGAEAAAHIHCGRRSVAYVWSRDIVDFFRSRILFRWF
jgi:multidrug efflux pump subunit AcrA (membrane-fusion protein)